MKIQYKKLAFSILAAAVLCTATVITAFCDSRLSRLEINVNNIEYVCETEITANSDGAHAAIRAARADGEAIDAGSVGLDLIMFREDGALMGSTGDFYSSESTNELTQTYDTSLKGSYFAFGKISCWKGESNILPSYESHLTGPTRSVICK